MTAKPKQLCRVEEYLRIERGGSAKHEYHHGEIDALAGSSAAHNIIQVNLLTSLGTQLRKRPCTVFPQPDGNWLLISHGAREDLIHLDAISCDLALEDVYNNVELDDPAG